MAYRPGGDMEGGGAKRSGTPSIGSLEIGALFCCGAFTSRVVLGALSASGSGCSAGLGLARRLAGGVVALRPLSEQGRRLGQWTKSAAAGRSKADDPKEGRADQPGLTLGAHDKLAFHCLICSATRTGAAPP